MSNGVLYVTKLFNNVGAFMQAGRMLHSTRKFFVPYGKDAREKIKINKDSDWLRRSNIEHIAASRH